MNTVDVKLIHNTVEVRTINNTVEVKLIPVKTIQKGFMGLQTYEEVKPID